MVRNTLTHETSEIIEKPTDISLYEVHITFTEKAIVTLHAPSEESAVAIVLDQYQSKLKDLEIISSRKLDDNNKVKIN